MKKTVLTVIILFMCATASFAGGNDIGADKIATAEDLQNLTRELGHAISIPSMTPADPLGMTLGVDIGVEVSGYELGEAKNLFDDDFLALTRVHAMKGLPFSIDVGAQYSKVFDSNISSVGAEIRWAALEDGLVAPAIGFRGTYSKLLNVKDIDITTYGLDVQISKEVAIVTPYAGAGYLSSKGDVDKSGIGCEKENYKDIYAGLKLSMFFVNITFQADFSENTMYTLKLGVDF